MAPGRVRKPYWLAGPTRYARLTQAEAKATLLVVGLVAVAFIVAAAGSTIGDDHAIGAAAAAINLSIVEGMRHGGGFYSVAAATLRSGSQAPPPLAFPMPMLPLLEARLPGIATIGMFYLLMASAVLAWYARLRPTLQRGATLVPPMLVALGVTTALRSDLVAVPESWAGGLIAIAIAVRQPGRWIEAAALALIAMLLAPVAALFAAIMAGFAMLERHRREAFGWLAALIVGVIAWYFHLTAAADTSGTFGFGSLAPGLLGLGTTIDALLAATALAVLPVIVGAAVIGCALLGWAAWDDAARSRMIVVVGAYIAAIAVVASPVTIIWVALITPVLPVGLVLAPDAVGDLVHRALDKRRITVTRIGR